MASRWPDVDAVVLGASAGGVEAVMALLPAFAADAPRVLVVLHRGPASGLGRAAPSLAALLARECRLPVDEAWDHQPLLRGQVVLAPADYHLLVDPGAGAGAAAAVAALSIDPPVLWSRPAIDPLFESAAAVFGTRLLAIVLTGASADGSAGARCVRQAGGELWVQNPADAVAATMPQAALDHAGADQVLTIREMCSALSQAGLRRPR